MYLKKEVILKIQDVSSSKIPAAASTLSDDSCEGRQNAGGREPALKSDVLVNYKV